VNILYCLNNVSMVMTIWKWSLVQTIVDRYSLRQLLVSYMKTTYQLFMKRDKLVWGRSNILLEKGNEVLDILIDQCQGL
jgi:hypothetical protein